MLLKNPGPDFMGEQTNEPQCKDFGSHALNEIVAKLKSMKINEEQNHEINLFIMASYDLNTFSNFVFGSTFLERFDVDQETVEKIKSNETELLKFGMEWLHYALFGEGNIRPKLK